MNPIKRKRIVRKRSIEERIRGRNRLLIIPRYTSSYISCEMESLKRLSFISRGIPCPSPLELEKGLSIGEAMDIVLALTGESIEPLPEKKQLQIPTELNVNSVVNVN